jgi:hypothetical protein
MQSALYFPMIRGREGEIHAIHRLSPLARARIALIVDLPTKELAPTQSLDAYVARFISDIAAAWGTSHPIYLPSVAAYRFAAVLCTTVTHCNRFHRSMQDQKKFRCKVRANSRPRPGTP